MPTPFVDAVETGRRIQRLRRRAGLTQQAMAYEAGLSTRTVAKVENGSGASLGTLRALADVLGATPNQLLAWRPRVGGNGR